MTRIELHKIKRPRPNKADRQVWMLRWYGQAGKRYGETIGEVGELTKHNAERIQRDKQSAIDGGKVRVDKARKMTLADFEIFHQDSIKGDIKPSTLACYRIAFKHAKTAIGKDTAIARIDAADVGRLKRLMQDDKLSPTSRRTMLVCLRCIFNRAVKWKLTNENPFADGKLPEAQSKDKRIFQQDEESAMLYASTSLWWRAFIKLAITSGLRLQELEHLQWTDIDFDDGAVTVQPKRAEKFKANSKEYNTLEWSPKSHQARHVPVPESTLDTLNELRNHGVVGSPYVFIDLPRLAMLNDKQRTGSLHARYEAINNVLRDFHCIQAGAAKLMIDQVGGDDQSPAWKLGTIHDLRKTYGTRMADVVPMHVLQKWMGHRYITTTADYYLGQSDRHGDIARAAMDGKPLLKLAG